jgi:hypothetical protein
MHAKQIGCLNDPNGREPMFIPQMTTKQALRTKQSAALPGEVPQLVAIGPQETYS